MMKEYLRLGGKTNILKDVFSLSVSSGMAVEAIGAYDPDHMFSPAILPHHQHGQTFIELSPNRCMEPSDTAKERSGRKKHTYTQGV